MDRSYKKADRVHVYQSAVTDKLLDVFDQQPYSRDGLDYYRYQKVMYPGYAYRGNDTVVYILLDQPLQ